MYIARKMSAQLITAAAILGGGIAAGAQEITDSVPTVEDEWLDEVVVTATRPVITSTAEKTTYDVAADPDSKSMTLLDLLRKVPGVTVDAQDNVTVNGSGSFIVEIDGRTNPAFSQDAGKIFKSIPASVVQRVEVVSAPGARYDAEGVGGVLNIVMRGASENLDGYSLTLTADASNVSQGGSIFGMMQKGRVGLTLNLSGARGRMNDMHMDMMRSQADGFGLLYSGIMKNKFAYGRAQLDASVKLSEADRLVLSGSWNIYDWKTPFRATSITYMDGLELARRAMLADNRGTNNYVTAGADYSHIFRGDSRNKLRVAYQFDTQPSRTTSISAFADDEATLRPSDDDRSENHNNMPQHMMLAEYALPIGDMHTIEAGGKMTWRNSESRGEELDYKHSTAIAAGFASYGLTAGNFSSKAGLRYEHTAQHARYLSGTGDDFRASYSNLVPSLTAAWSFGPTRSLSAAYSMRISRPGIEYLNPYENTANPIEVTVGNPQLHPERYNSVALAYNGMHGTLIFNSRLDYTFCNDGLTPITTMEQGVQYKTFANSLHQKQVSLQAFVNWRIGTKTTLMCTLTPTYTSMRAGELANHGWKLMAFGGLQQKLPWELNLGVNIFAMTPDITLQGRGMSQFVHMLSLSRSFLKEQRLNVSVTAVNPFYARMNIKQTQSAPDFVSRTTGYMNLRMVQLTVSIRLGSLNSRTEQRVSIDSDAVGGSAGGSSVPTPAVGM